MGVCDGCYCHADPHYLEGILMMMGVRRTLTLPFLLSFVVVVVVGLLELYATSSLTKHIVLAQQNNVSTYGIYDPVKVFSPSKRNDTNVALCVCVKNETQYIDEWVDFHIALGFSPLFIYDNAPTPNQSDMELQSWYERRKDIQQHIHIIHMHIAPVQGYAFERCIRKDAKDATFIGLLDIDEFVVLKKHDNIVDMMMDHCDLDCAQLSINWRTMGTSNEERYQPVPITKRNIHVHTYEPLFNIIKVIVRPSYIADYIDWSHSLMMKKGHWVDTDGTKIPRVYSTTLNVRPPYEWKGPTDVAVLYHYRFKSEYEFFVKSCIRGEAIRSQGVMPKCDHMMRKQNYPRGGGEFDDIAWKQLTRMVPKYALFDEKKDATMADLY